MAEDTISAVITALGEGAVGIVRISGEQALAVAEQLFCAASGKKLSAYPVNTLVYGHILDTDGTMVDEVLTVYMRAPHSYTAEDVVEIQCHGGLQSLKKILALTYSVGARPAEPGEFTKRAFLNGRIDLSQAEAVIDVINAKNEMALAGSVRQLKGNIQKKIKEIRSSIIGSVAFIEAALDDPEHIQADNFGEELRGKVCHDLNALEKLYASADNGRMMKEGIKTVIVGKPNAGKSSLLNILVGDERAIVTDIAGTTRDTLEEFINIHGIPLNIVDTAGIRNTSDIVEKIGVDKAKNFAEDADLIIYVVDGSTPIDENDCEIIELIKDKKVIVLINKIDLNIVTSVDTLKAYMDKPIVEISAKEEKGIDDFENLLKEMFFNGNVSFNDEIYITNVRHKTAIADAMESLRLVLQSIDDGMPEDFFSIDLMNSYEQLGGIIGEAVGEDLIDTIFSDFCMGK